LYSDIKQYCLTHGVDLLVVSKLRSFKEIEEVYQSGQRLFAENRVQDLLGKKQKLPQDIQWHIIGTLQRNKVKFIAPFIALIHSLDDFKLWEEIHRQAGLNHRVIPCLLQIRIAEEETKHGFSYDQLLQVLKQETWKSLHGAAIQGVMGMASLTEDPDQIRKEFKTLKSYFDHLKSQYFDYPEFNILSMGMSGDYKIAIEEGSTMVRVGSAVFT